MRIIDAKGRLFGLINIIDLGVIVTLVVFGYISFNLARNAKLGYPIEVEAKVLFPSLPLKIVKKMYPGDMEDRSRGRSSLIRLEIRKPYIEKNGNTFADVHAWINLSLRVKDVLIGNKGEKGSSFFLKGQELNIDDSITLTTSKYSIRGTLLNIGLMDREIEVVLNTGFPDEMIDAVRVGDRVIRWGHVTGDVLAKEYTHDGKVRVRLHIKRGEVDLKIGQHFSVHTENCHVGGIIVKSRPWKKK